MNDPLRSLWTTPDPEGRPLPTEPEPRLSDTASIAEQAGFSLGPPTLAPFSGPDPEDHDAAAAEAEDVPADQEAAAAVARTPAAEESSTPDAEAWSPESEGSPQFDSAWNVEPSLEADARGRDASDWDADETGWDPDGSAPVILGPEEPAARPSLVLAELQAWEATFQSAARASEPQAEHATEAAAEQGAPPKSEVASEPEPEAPSDVEAQSDAAAEAEHEGEAEHDGSAPSEDDPGEAAPHVEGQPEPEPEPPPDVEAAPDVEARSMAAADAEHDGSVPSEDDSGQAREPDVDAEARARALAAAWIPRSTPSPVPVVSSVFGGPAPWATQADETAGGSDTSRPDGDDQVEPSSEDSAAATTTTSSEDVVDLSGSEAEPPEPEPVEMELFALSTEGADEDRWWVEPAESSEGTTSEADESTSVSDGLGEREGSGPEVAADDDLQAEAAKADGGSGAEPGGDTVESWGSAWSWPAPATGGDQPGGSTLSPAAADAAAGSAPDDEASWPPAPELSAPTEPLSGTGFASASARRDTPGIMERHLEPPTGVRSFSVLSASPGAVPSRQPVPLVGESTDASTGEATTVDLGAPVDGHDEPPTSQAAQMGTMTPEAQLRAQFRQRVAAAAGATGSTPAPNALWLLTGEPERASTADDDLPRSRIVNVVLTVFAIIVVVVLVLGFLVLVVDLL